MPYFYNGTTLPNVSNIVAPFAGRVATADTPGRPGGYTGRRYAGTRGITVTGVLQVALGGDLDAAWATLCAAHDVQTAQQLVLRDGWYFLALPENVSESERTVSSLQWEATYRAADPYAFSTAVSTPTLDLDGGAVLVGGNAPARPAIALTVSAIASGCSVRITSSLTGELLILSPDAIGDWNIDCLAETISFNALDRSDAMQGQFLSLTPNASNYVVVACTGGAAISAVSMTFRARSV